MQCRTGQRNVILASQPESTACQRERTWNSSMDKVLHRSRFIFLIIAIHLSCVPTVAAESNWPRFRGAEANGQTREKGLPQQWSVDTITWKTALPGRRNSSPMIWGERVFLTSEIDRGRQRVVMCLDRNNGRILWQDVAWTGNPEPAHERNSRASSAVSSSVPAGISTT